MFNYFLSLDFQTYFVECLRCFYLFLIVCIVWWELTPVKGRTLVSFIDKDRRSFVFAQGGPKYCCSCDPKISLGKQYLYLWATQAVAAQNIMEAQNIVECVFIDIFLAPCCRFILDCCNMKSYKDGTKTVFSLLNCFHFKEWEDNDWQVWSSIPSNHLVLVYLLSCSQVLLYNMQWPLYTLHIQVIHRL